MTTQKKLKRQVRSRMQKTGERYAAARRSFASAPGAAPQASTPGLLPGYRRVGGPLADLSAVANALTATGAVAPHTDEPYSDAMVLGLGGGVGGGYFMFQFGGTPTVAVIGTRHLWQSPERFIEGALRRLGADPETFESTGRKRADAALETALDARRPVIAWVDRASLPYLFLPDEFKKHAWEIVGVCGRDPATGEVLLDDRASTPLAVDADAFSVARGLITSSKSRLIHVDPPKGTVDLAAAILDAIAYGHRERTQPEIRNFGLPALAKWADIVASPKDAKGWPRTLPVGHDLYRALVWAYEAIEPGTGGGAHRRAYASFLDEAAAVTGLDALRRIADDYRALAADWTALAAALLPDAIGPLARTRAIVDRRARLLETRGAAALPEIGSLAEEQRSIEAASADPAWLSDGDRLALFRGLSDRLRTLHAAELAASDALAAAVGARST